MQIFQPGNRKRPFFPPSFYFAVGTSLVRRLRPRRGASRLREAQEVRFLQAGDTRPPTYFLLTHTDSAINTRTMSHGTFTTTDCTTGSPLPRPSSAWPPSSPPHPFSPSLCYPLSSSLFSPPPAGLSASPPEGRERWKGKTFFFLETHT